MDPDLLNITPPQFETIKALRQEYYLYLDNLMVYYKQISMLSEILGCLNLLTEAVLTAAAAAEDDDDGNDDESVAAVDAAIQTVRDTLSTIRQTLQDSGGGASSSSQRRRNRRRRRQGDDRMIMNATEEDMEDLDELRIVRRNNNGHLRMDADGYKWLTTVEAIKALMHFRTIDSIGLISDNAQLQADMDMHYYLEQLAMRESNAHHQEIVERTYHLLDPTYEWQLYYSLDLTDGSRSRRRMNDNRSGGGGGASDIRNIFQLSEDAQTFEGMKRMVQFAKDEVDSYRTTWLTMTAKIMQMVDVLAAAPNSNDIHKIKYIVSELMKTFTLEQQLNREDEN